MRWLAHQAAAVLAELEKRESDYTRLQRARITPDDFEPLTIIGRGAFGEVRGDAGYTNGRILFGLTTTFPEGIPLALTAGFGVHRWCTLPP